MDLLIFGAGGHAREVAWLARDIFGARTRLTFVVDHSRFVSGPVNGDPVKHIDDLPHPPGTPFTAALGDIAARKRSVGLMRDRGYIPVSLVHPTAGVAPTASLGSGVIIARNSIVSTDASLGDYAHINIGCTISHDVSIGEYTTVSPGVHVAGGVLVAAEVLIGIGASIINSTSARPISIGSGATIAAGACVTKSVEPRSLVAGVPAVRKR